MLQASVSVTLAAVELLQKCFVTPPLFTSLLMNTDKVGTNLEKCFVGRIVEFEFSIIAVVAFLQTFRKEAVNWQSFLR